MSGIIGVFSNHVGTRGVYVDAVRLRLVVSFGCFSVTTIKTQRPDRSKLVFYQTSTGMSIMVRVCLLDRGCVIDRNR